MNPETIFDRDATGKIISITLKCAKGIIKVYKDKMEMDGEFTEKEVEYSFLIEKTYGGVL